MSFYCNDTHEKPRNYTEYLKSEHWNLLRESLKDAAGYVCQICHGKDKRLEIHHKHYSTLGHEARSDLMVLCGDCHAKLHDIKKNDGQKVFREYVHLSAGAERFGFLVSLCNYDSDSNTAFARSVASATCPHCKSLALNLISNAIDSGEKIPKFKTTAAQKTAQTVITNLSFKRRALEKNIKNAREFERKRFFSK
jgi:hypothetical protein